MWKINEGAFMWRTYVRITSKYVTSAKFEYRIIESRYYYYIYYYNHSCNVKTDI